MSSYTQSIFIYGLVSKGSLNIPEYRCLLIGRVKYLYTIEHAVENIAYFSCKSISITLLYLFGTHLKLLKQPLDGFILGGKAAHTILGPIHFHASTLISNLSTFIKSH